MSALEGSIEALPVGRSASAGSNGDDDGLMAMDLQQARDHTQTQRERKGEEGRRQAPAWMTVLVKRAVRQSGRSDVRGGCMCVCFDDIRRWIV